MAGIQVFGKPIEKLIDTIGKGVGIIFEPTRIRRKADADVYRLEKLDQAKAKGLILKAETQLDITERAQIRINNQELNRQLNIEEIIAKAIEHLGDNASDEPVDDDWRSRFFNKAQDVSSEKMQEIWAKILAEEVSEPGRL